MEGLDNKKLEAISLSDIEAMSRDALIALVKEMQQTLLEYQGVIFKLKTRIYSPKSERSLSLKTAKTSEKKPRSHTTKLPSERYPEATIVENDIDFADIQICPCCGESMEDSGMTEDSEYLTIKAKEYMVVRQKRHKHRCKKCHSTIATAPSLPRVIPGGSYSDEMIIDATLSKFCDLIPMERYCKMAERNGFAGLPPQSLIQASFKMAEFMQAIYERIKEETLNTAVLLADETPHKMLEGDERKNWFLWQFLNGVACFFECHDTRSGDVSSNILKDSNCLVLLSDAYSGYSKSIKAVNEIRKQEDRPIIQTALCNAHARREFYSGKNIDKDNISPDALFMVEQYKEIYKLEAEAKGLSDKEILEKRALMKPFFETMKKEAELKIDTYSSKSAMGQAYGYFLNHYDGLTLFLGNPRIPIDNNASERRLRSHVVGRKTWYGTHSREGAWAAARHFTIVETCKLNDISPYQYYGEMVNRLHYKQKVLTPFEYKKEVMNDIN